MAGLDANREKERVQQATDLVRLIGEQIALKPRGREFLGLCPFHRDSNPSMYVSPVKQIYKCFSCGAGGDAFSFVMSYHKMAFPDALEHLAQRAGISLEQRDQSQGNGPSERDRLLKANKWALDFFRRQLADPAQGKPARDYLARRGISQQMVEAFQLGYAPDGWDGLVHAASKLGGPVRDLERAGLISPRKSGNGHYDRFRHRLIFPILDGLGRPLAFGGRRLREEDEPKYLNSPESRIFHKSATLYGLHQAKRPILARGEAVVVEGYTDVIACHQVLSEPHEGREIVATLGTALTEEHVAELRRYAQRVVLVFDPDAAGQKAADRAVELFLTGDLDVAIALLPEGLDPAELVTGEDGPKQWAAVLASAEDALEHQFHRIREQMAEEGTVTGRQQVAEQYLAQLARQGAQHMGPVRHGLVVQRLASLLGMTESAVQQAIQQAAPRRSHPSSPRLNRDESRTSGTEIPQKRGGEEPQAIGGENFHNNSGPDIASGQRPPKLRAVAMAELQLIGCLIRCNEQFHATGPDGHTVDESIPPGEMTRPAHRRLYGMVYHRLAENEPVTLTGLLSEIALHESADLASLASLATEADTQVEKAAGENVERIQELMRGAVRAIVEHRAEQHYREARGLLDDAADNSRQFRELIEHNRGHPSPARLFRGRQ